VLHLSGRALRGRQRGVVERAPHKHASRVRQRAARQSAAANETKRNVGINVKVLLRVFATKLTETKHKTNILTTKKTNQQFKSQHNQIQRYIWK
jgi:DNA-directed RNA polymerase subunit E'/Rpb7